jgi:hypothetical protein
MHMSRLIWKHRILAARLGTARILLVLIAVLTSCHKSETPTTVQRTFASPEEAWVEVLEACKSGNQAALLAIFSPDSKDLLFQGMP